MKCKIDCKKSNRYENKQINDGRVDFGDSLDYSAVVHVLPKSRPDDLKSAVCASRLNNQDYNTQSTSASKISPSWDVFKEIRRISSDLDPLYEKADYTAALTLLAGLSVAVEAFFDKVMVMDDDPQVRKNRLSLLAELKGLFDRIANLALLG